jgi:ABC-type maltose transport system permease subunit
MAEKKNLRLNCVSVGTEAVFHVLIGLFSVCCIIPFLFVIIISFSSKESITTIGYSFIPTSWSMDAYQYAFNKLPQIWRSYFNSIYITVIGTVLSTTMCAMYAYVLYRPDFKFRSFFNFLSFFTMIFGGGLVPTYIVSKQLLGLSENYAALIVPLLVSPFNIIVMRSFFKSSVPLELIEAATIDGSGEYSTLFRVVVQARHCHHRSAERSGLLERLVQLPAVHSAEEGPAAPAGAADGTAEQHGILKPYGRYARPGRHRRGGEDAVTGSANGSRRSHCLRLPLLPALHRFRPDGRLREGLIPKKAVPKSADITYRRNPWLMQPRLAV